MVLIQCFMHSTSYWQWRQNSRLTAWITQHCATVTTVHTHSFTQWYCPTHMLPELWAVEHCHSIPCQSGKFLQFHRKETQKFNVTQIHPHSFHKSRSVHCHVSHTWRVLQMEFKNEDTFHNCLTANFTSILNCVTQVLNKAHKSNSIQKHCTAQVH